jgi:hypothetical protein
MCYIFLSDIFRGSQDLHHGKAGCVPLTPPQVFLPSPIFSGLLLPGCGGSVGLVLAGKLNYCSFHYQNLNTMTN